ncbi:MAG: ABC transporter substrate-binding protein [Spirochaetaceae bacterium]|nr:MAG: ABC transporter substrate-binding protein [Spirochaetaceae bacterium]
MMNARPLAGRITTWIAIAMTLAGVSLSAFAGGAREADTRNQGEVAQIEVVDQWDRTVRISGPVERVVVMEWEGLVAKTMRLLGVDEAIIGVDNYAARQSFRRHLVPAIGEATDIGSAWTGINYERLVSLRPDVVFLESWQDTEENRAMHATEVQRIEDLGIPVVVLVSPSNFAQPTLDRAWEHISIVGDVFQRPEEALRVVTAIEQRIDLVRERTQDIAPEDQVNVVLFATTNYAMGVQSVQSYMLTEVVNANNLMRSGTFVPISEEQLLSLNPDVLVVLGHDGYLDPDLIFAGANMGLNWGNLQQLPAIAERRVVSLGYEEWRATIENAVGLLKIAKAVYPDRFADIDLEQEELRLYQEIYGMSESQARQAAQLQLWIDPSGFVE